MSREILDCLKRKQDICIKNIIPSQNTAFMFPPALSSLMKLKDTLSNGMTLQSTKYTSSCDLRKPPA